MVTNENLIEAKKQKNDEFYTRFIDVQEELCNYKPHFKNKVVLCNCDNPTQSAFWKYFHLNFKALGLKKLISTYYDNAKAVYKTEYMGGNDNDITVGIKTPLKGDGDFRSLECLNVLNEADIVVTNPPFSLFREYVSTLIKYDKKVIIIGNMNSITTKNVFPLFRDGKLWYGKSIHSGDRKFFVPDDYPLDAAGCGVDENGKRFIRVKGVRWFTNIDYKERHIALICTEKYSEQKYPKYDNYDAISVNKASEIPCDYAGEIGVPITFMDKYCPEQFEIVGISGDLAHPVTLSSGKRGSGRFYMNEKRLYDRIIIRYTEEWIASHPEDFEGKYLDINNRRYTAVNTNLCRGLRK